MQHIVSAQQFIERAHLENIIDRSFYFKKSFDSAPNKALNRLTNRLHGRIIATVFFEPSTRTRLSFESAAHRLGAQVISCENALHNGSAAKGESIEDTVQVISGYADLIIIRHPEKNAVSRGAKVATVPIINAGDGIGEHPTQALLDIFTMVEAFGSLDNKTITFVGDLKNGRTIHSTIQLASVFSNVTINLVSPASLRIPGEILDLAKSNQCTINEVDSWSQCIEQSDVLYMTRIQKERFESEQEYNRVKNDYILTSHLAHTMKTDSIILHPLPRVNEIEPEVDSNPRARYFEQARNGLYVRMALLDMLLSNEESLPFGLITKQVRQQGVQVTIS